jgi:hypothetical protein
MVGDQGGPDKDLNLVTPARRLSLFWIFWEGGKSEWSHFHTGQKKGTIRGKRKRKKKGKNEEAADPPRLFGFSGMVDYALLQYTSRLSYHRTLVQHSYTVFWNFMYAKSAS